MPSQLRHTPVSRGAPGSSSSAPAVTRVSRPVCLCSSPMARESESRALARALSCCLREFSFFPACMETANNPPTSTTSRADMTMVTISANPASGRA